MQTISKTELTEIYSQAGDFNILLLYLFVKSSF